MKATEILSRATDLVGGDRERQHGDKLSTFECIARLWTAWLNVRVDAHDVAQMMSLMKKARTQSGEMNNDDYIDDAGYAACAGEIVARQLEKQNQDKKPLDDRCSELDWMTRWLGSRIFRCR